MQCPKCNSENTQRLEVVFHGGTQEINTTGTTVGGAHGGAFGIGGAVTKTKGQSQSILAQKSAPPSKKSFKAAVILFVIGILMLGGQGATAFLGFLLIAAGAYLGYKNFQFNSKEWPSLYQQWLDSWLCHKCGTTYHHAV
ncbi:hypothetical protein FGKAn22_09900 [Ferrigenium kumadai]|uniref:Uncharacterized protein n=1 Tax=Ferrigenium kumadai TaxID=1682490 RepID=A0AAN1SYF7_9PROT|nr:hypothetical protein [Ferrigenium kumadai]BBI99297.1 hypothetical protein FGKAn22_09900 [Ferrigenium kumadai]